MLLFCSVIFPIQGSDVVKHVDGVILEGFAISGTGLGQKFIFENFWATKSFNG